MDKKILVSLTSVFGKIVDKVEKEANPYPLSYSGYPSAKEAFWESSSYSSDDSSIYKATLYLLEDGSREVEYQKSVGGIIVAAMNFNFEAK